VKAVNRCEYKCMSAGRQAVAAGNIYWRRARAMVSPVRANGAEQRSSLSNSASADWESVKDILSSLIKHKTRADGKSWRDAHENMPIYLRVSSSSSSSTTLRFACRSSGVSVVDAEAQYGGGNPGIECYTRGWYQRQGNWLAIRSCSVISCVLSADSTT